MRLDAFSNTIQYNDDKEYIEFENNMMWFIYKFDLNFVCLLI